MGRRKKKPRKSSSALSPKPSQSPEPAPDSGTTAGVRRSLEFYAGPVPDAATLERYQALLPNAADRIFTQFEEQGRHRRQIEVRGQDLDYKLKRGSQVATVFIALAFGGMATYLIALGQDAAGLLVFGMDVISLLILNWRRRSRPPPANDRA